MKLRVLSDLHLEFHDWRPPKAPSDVVVLAGDIHSGIEGILWGRKHFPETHIVYVPGNHEFYGREMQATLTELRHAAKTHRVHMLDGDAVVVEGVRILGATLWTDFALYGAEPSIVARAKAVAQQTMADYYVIRRRGNVLLAPDDTQQIHQLQVRWLARELEKPFAGATVVVTHHLPIEKSVHARYAGDALNPSFASDLSRLVRAPVTLWIHGHTHESMDYAVAGTRVVCNPRGYLPQEPNARFNPRMVVDI